MNIDYRRIGFRPSIVGCPSLWWAVSLIGVLAPLVARADPNDDRLLVLFGDVTAEGKNLTPVTPDHPVFYVPVVLGYKERGEYEKHFERKPPDESVLKLLVSTLEKQGYLLASPQSPPSLTITFEWGTIAPVFVGKSVMNAAEIRNIVLGGTAWEFSNRYGGFTHEMLSVTARHYVLISAFAYQRSNKARPDVLLWRVHSTTDAWGDYLADLMKPLVANAALTLGKSAKPGTVWADTKTGTVTIGNVRIVDDEKPARMR
jgi:hypothetical protein